MWFKVLRVRYGEEDGRSCFGGEGGSTWWQNLNHIISGQGMLDEK